MKRTRYISLIIVLLSVLNITAQQQQSQYALYNYRNDGDFNAWLNIDVDSITYSNIGLDSIEYDNIVTQEVWTPDSCYRIPLEVIDSIGFRAPKPIMREGLFYLRDYHAALTNSIDSLTIYFDDSILQDSLPSIGQPILCATKMTPYEDGFAGKVIEIKTTSEGIAVICEEIGIADIFQQLVLVGKVLSEQADEEPMDSRKKASDPWINLEESNVKFKELKPISFDLFDGLIEVTSPRPRLTCSYYIYVSEVYYEIFAKVDLQHRDLTYKLTLSTDQLKDLEDYGSFFKALATDNIDEWLNEKMNKSVKKYIEEQKYEDKLAEASIAEKIWKTKKWDIPIIEDGALNLTLTIAPLFKTKGSISAVTEFKTDAMQSMRIKVSGITPLGKYTSKINDAKASFHQNPIKSTTLDIQAKGSVTLGFTALLNVNVVHRNVLYAGIGGEFGVDFTGILNATIIDTEQPDMNMYDRLKDTNLKITEYGKWYLEAGVSPLDIFHLRGPKWDLFSPSEQIYYLMPHFKEPQMPKFGERTWLGKDPLSFYTYASKDVFIPCRIGMRITDEDGNVKKEYINDNEKYVWEKDWLNRSLKIDVSDLPAGVSYRCYPVMSFLNGTVFNAGPHHDFYVPLPMVASPSELTLAVGSTADVQFFGGWDTFAVVMEEGEDVASIVEDGEPRLIRVKGNKVGTASLRIEDRRTNQVVHVPINVTKDGLPYNIALSTNVISLQKDESTSVLVTSGSGNYTAESSNENVATATVEDDMITITAISVGSAVISVTDTETEETATIEVSVTDSGGNDAGQELIVNGDFSSGNTGFTSDYVYVSETGGYALQEEGKYAVGTSPSIYHRFFINHGDHTTGTGNMLIVNGSRDNTQYVWKQNVPVKKGKTYEFSAWLISAVSDDTAKEKVEYSINGEPCFGTYDMTEDGWSRYFVKYSATENSEIELKIRTVSEEGVGNDFALDDISFFGATNGFDDVLFSPDEGTAGVGSSENYNKLVDGDSSTKWCFQNNGRGYVVFHASQPINVTGYKITTGNDTSSYPSRNPKSWTLYGSTADRNPGENGTSWEIIDSVTDDTQLQAVNETTYLYKLPSETSKAYRYFKWVITSPNGIVQVSEIRPTYYDSSAAGGGGGSW